MRSVQASLSTELKMFRAAMLQRLPPHERDAMAPSEAEIRSALRDRPVPQPGTVAPDFALPDQHGAMVRLTDRLSQGPVVVVFIRGGWCPFCTLTLRAYQAALPAIHDAGADLLAITPQPATTCSEMAERDLLAFQTLSDVDNRVAGAYGIAFETHPAIRPMLERLGHDVPRINGTGNWVVPLPATFVIGPDRRVVLAHFDSAQYQRLDPMEAIATLQALPVPA